MAENFQDNVSYGNSTLAVSGDAIAVGSTNANAKSVIFNNSGSQGHLAWQPSANRTINLPDSGGTIQLTGQAPGAIIAGTQTATSGSIIFSNSNGLTFGMSNSSVITGSYTVPSTAGLISGVNISAGTTSNNLSALTFSNSNGLSFGLNGSTITGSYTVPIQTAQTVGFYGLGNTTQNSSTTLDARSLSFNGLGNITVGYSNGSIQVSGSQSVQTASSLSYSNLNGISFGIAGSTLTASYTVPTQTNQTEGRYAIGNTTGQSSSSTFDARTLSISGAGNISVGYSGNALVISGAGGGGGGSVNISAGTTSNNLTNFVFSNSNQVSFGLSGSTITGSIPNQTYVFSNSNNISFGLNGSTITATATFSQTAQMIGLYAVSNTTGGSSSTTIDARSLSFQGAGVASVGYTNGSVVISVPSGGGAGVNILAAGTQTANTTGTVLFSNSNGISFGMSNNSVITASVAAGTLGFYAVGNTVGQSSSSTFDIRTLSFSGAGIASVGYSGNNIVINVPSAAASVNVSAGTTSGNLTNFVFSNSNGISFGLNGSTVTGSYTVPTQSNQTEGRYAIGNTTGQSSSSTFDARSLSFSGAGIASVGYSGNALIISVPSAGASINISAGTTSGNLGAVTFSNSNGITFGLSNGVITATVTPGAAAGVAAVQAGTQTQTSGTLVFANSNGLTFGLSGSSQITASYTVPTQSSLSFSNANGVTFGIAGSTLTASVSPGGGGLTNVNISAGTTSGNLSNFVFSNSNGVSFGLSGSTITASAAGGGGGNVNISAGTTSNNLTNFVFSNSNSVSFGLSGSTVTASVPGATSIVGTSGISLSSNGSTLSIGMVPAISLSNNMQQYTAFQFGNGSAAFFPINGCNASFSKVDMLMSVTMSSGTQMSGTMSLGVGLFTLNGSTLSMASSGSASHSWSNSSTAPTTANLVGIRALSIPINVNMTPGNYWVGFYSHSTTGGANSFTMSNIIASWATNAFSGVFNSATNASNCPFMGQGIFSASSSTLNASYALSDLRGASSASNRIPIYQFANVTA